MMDNTVLGYSYAILNVFDYLILAKMKFNISSDGKLNGHPNELKPNSCKLNKSLND